MTLLTYNASFLSYKYMHTILLRSHANNYNSCLFTVFDSASFMDIFYLFAKEAWWKKNN